MSQAGPIRTHATRGASVDEPIWRWPIDLNRYDRAYDLTSEEGAALATLGDDVRAWRSGTRPEFRVLGRLIQPLADARAALDASSRHCARSADVAVARLLRCCAQTGASYWAWEPAVWIGVLGRDQPGFLAAHPRWVDRSARHYLIGLAYLLRCFADLRELGHFKRPLLAEKVFGPAPVRSAIERVEEVLRNWGYRHVPIKPDVARILGDIFLMNGSPRLADVTPAVLETLRARAGLSASDRSIVSQVQRSLAALGIGAPPHDRGGCPPPVRGVSPEWARWVMRWEATSAVAPATRKHVRTCLLKAGRWLAANRPEAAAPAAWTRELCAAYIAAVDRMHVGDYVQRQEAVQARMGQPLSARSKDSYLGSLRQFFRDAQEWGWIARRFNPARALATPRSVKALIGPNPRVIADHIWAKLLWAGLNFEYNDLPIGSSGARFYPVELVRALGLTWLFSALRSDEIVRLRVGCVRWQRPDAAVPSEADRDAAQDDVCFLDVPVNKTGTAFTKPVDPILGRAIQVWERVRPAQPPLPDPRTGESVEMLFCYRAKRLPRQYLNQTMIPALCRKGGVPLADARGRITSHRARSTIASQLYNAKEPMSLFELQEWLGHRSPASTQHYAKITPTKLAKVYADAGYFARNIRTIDVLLDREAVRNGAAAKGLAWQYFDLGHGYCSYSFFETCSHRMACARCDFYLPKDSAKAQLLEAKANLQRMHQTIPLTEEERAAVEDGAAAVDRLLERLADVPTPAGPTPRELAPATSTKARGGLTVDST